MDINEYQTKTGETQLPQCRNLDYLMLGLIGEVGELANKYKKVLRDQDGRIYANNMADFNSELGDVAWYWARILDFLGVEASNCLKGNLDKLNKRKEEGKLQGSGDNR